MHTGFPTTATLTRAVSRQVYRAEVPNCFATTYPQLSGSRLPRWGLSSTAKMDAKFAPAKRVAGQRQDVWSIVNEAAAASPVQPIVNMGQGFL